MDQAGLIERASQGDHEAFGVLVGGHLARGKPWSRHSKQKPKVYPRSAGIIAARAPVAQWIERRPPEPKVAGSNPVGRARTHVLFSSAGLSANPERPASVAIIEREVGGSCPYWACMPLTGVAPRGLDPSSRRRLPVAAGVGLSRFDDSVASNLWTGRTTEAMVANGANQFDLDRRAPSHRRMMSR